MPTYVYKATDENGGCDACRGGFETVQRMADPHLERCPTCGAAIHRVPQAPNVNLAIINGKISDSKLKACGFTKITKDADGKYRKAYGSDPAADCLPSHSKKP